MKTGNNYLFEEFHTIGDGRCLDLIQIKPWGYEHDKLYIPNLKEEELPKILEDRNLPTDVKHIKTTDIEEREYPYDQIYHVKSNSTEELMKQLYKIEELGNIRVRGQDTTEFTVTYYFSFLIYEIKNMSVKVPIKTDSNGEVRWGFEYIIYPNFTVNSDILERIKKISDRSDLELNINGKGIKNNLREDTYRMFSTSFFNYLQKSFMNKSIQAKAIVNAVRNMGHHETVLNEFYEVFQKSRINKRENMQYKGYEYVGPEILAREITFKDYLDLLETDIAEISNITKDKIKFLEYIEKYGEEKAYEPVLIYMKNLDNPFEAMETYEKIEKERVFIRKLKFQLNMMAYDNMTYLQDYIEYVYPYHSQYNRREKPMFLTSLMWSREDNYEGYRAKEYKPRSNNKMRRF